MKNNSSNGQLTATRTAADSPVLTETLRRLRNQTPAESLGLAAGSGLLKPFLQAAAASLILLALLTVVPYFVDPPKSAEAKGPPPIPERQEPAPSETPKDQQPSKPGPEGTAKTPTPASPKGNKGDDILNKLGENGTKTASPKVNPLDKKDDDLLKDIK
jgi:hypothetical protein